ncbi:MAG: LysM peptidoglycan-binding domain-containing protein [Candidatus Omnitrophota bacterium]|nr:LysM peptidoglycan-binding domain-containing protein [Candidatus Omnitrophota bacterium]
MQKMKLIYAGFLLSLFCFALSGCVARHYAVIKERVDQDLTQGNRGYIQGSVPPQQDESRPKTRKTHTVEIEMANPFKIKNLPPVDETKKKGSALESGVVSADEGMLSGEESNLDISQSAFAVEEYVVQKGDTLQKISSKFYGTTKKWAKIYDANKNVLKSPDRVYPGQKISIPKE